MSGTHALQKSGARDRSRRRFHQGRQGQQWHDHHGLGKTQQPHLSRLSDCKLLSLGALLHPVLSLSPGFQGVHGGSEPQFKTVLWHLYPKIDQNEWSQKGQVKCFFNCLIFCHPSSFKCGWGCAYKSWRDITKMITAFLQCWTWSKSPTRKKCHKKFRQSFWPSSSCKKIWILKKNESFLHYFTFSSDFEVSIDSLR